MMLKPLPQETIRAEGLSDGSFDFYSGSFLELLIFNNRRLIIALCMVLTVIFGWSAAHLKVNASYTAMLPEHHPYIINYEANSSATQALGDSVRIVVENKSGNIYDPHYLAVLRKINDAVFLLPGVDRSFMKSLWMPAVRWTTITEQGATGGPVMPDSYNGSADSIAQLRQNIMQAGIIGSIVANDQKSSEIFVPLLERDAATGRPFNYGKFWTQLQNILKSQQSPGISIHVIGFAAVMGNLIAGVHEMLGFFAIAALIATLFIFTFTRCIRSTFTILACSLVAIVWLLGLIQLLGYVLDPYSILVPFLVFAIGLSHGAQKMNGIMQDIGRGTSSLVAARLTFRRLFIAGLTALIADAVGFVVLTVIDIEAIRSLAVTASIGVTVLIFTNLVLLPVLLSYIGVSNAAALRSLEAEDPDAVPGVIENLFRFLEHFSSRRWASVVLAGTCVLLVGGYLVGRNVQIGDLNAGAPELRVNSTYNQDNAYVMAHYSLSNDEFAIIVRSPPGGLDTFPAVLEMDRFEQYMRKIPGVQTTVSAADFARLYTAGQFEGNLKWLSINRNTFITGAAMNDVFVGNPELVNNDGSAAPLIIYLKDHKAKTLATVAKAAQSFADANSSPAEQFLLAAGSAGIAAATNMVVTRADGFMPYLVYAAVILLCFISFRNWRAVVVAIVPLIVTSVLCRALMVLLGIGVKVATLPVIALGVGIGVDYALYLLSIQMAFQRMGEPSSVAYGKALRFTGRIVALVGFTLAAGVSLWAFSPIKFQADMGVLLTFMFLWNMVGALILIPALSHFIFPASKKEGLGAGK
ncbi:RND family transporter [Acidocella sp. KAb 2-4]|uniref:efflux RND transporter permease subunit n=1 Tax=Acidocella sp. KAb 2-4 TaxID=2885158 RepID=UPI001D05C433|nr:MMPL family transporter [Acidocella sp. KAb 2-4]MCB5944234.1 MMPL family transporter [Acidocella sp. KAb 2-4]